MKKLVIVGASAMGRETCAYARECGYNVVGFLDSRKGILDDYPGYPPIIGSVEEFPLAFDGFFVCAVGEPSVRREYIESMPNAKWATIIHPKAFVGPNVRIGEGCIVCPHSTVTCDAEIGCHVIVNVNSTISHDCSVGDYATLSPGVNVAGWCEVGEETFFGVSSAVIPHVKIGKGVFVAAGALVVKSTDGPRIMGVPGREK